MYKWTDASGTVHYSDKAPASQKTLTVPVPDGPPRTAPVRATPLAAREAAQPEQPGLAPASLQVDAMRNIALYSDAPPAKCARPLLLTAVTENVALNPVIRNGILLDGKWTERWTVDQCGTLMEYRVQFYPDGTGGMFSAVAFPGRPALARSSKAAAESPSGGTAWREQDLAFRQRQMDREQADTAEQYRRSLQTMSAAQKAIECSKLTARLHYLEGLIPPASYNSREQEAAQEKLRKLHETTLVAQRKRVAEACS